MTEPLIYSVGSTSLQPGRPEDLDPRGYVWTWEAPNPSATYVLGIDTAVGITGWNRSLRIADDIERDNGCIQVLRVGRGKQPDVQVAEYAAPVDQYELATVVNFLGRLYAGNADDGQALACIEMNNGGWATHETLVNRYGYMNMPIWTQIGKGLTARPTQMYGWYSNRSTRRDLWIKGMRHINLDMVLPNSPWLVEEMVDCTWDNFLTQITARSRFHDDRVVSLLIAIWYAHEWSLELDPPDDQKLEVSGLPDYQRSAMTYEEAQDEWNERMDRTLG